MRRYNPQFFASPISLPEATSGGVSVKHREVTDRTPLIGVRQAFTRGIRPVMLKLESPLTIHELSSEKNGVWMTDLPEELNQIGEMIYTAQPWGRVLVGGLGLGILPKMLRGLCDDVVTQITVVEINPHVIELCQAPGYRVVYDDIFRFIENHDAPFDTYLLDTWQMTGEAAWWSTVMPLRRLIRNRWGRRPVVHCWAEDIMLGQIRRSLEGPHRHWHHKKLPLMNAAQAGWFMKNVGLPAWEKKYGLLVPHQEPEAA